MQAEESFWKFVSDYAWHIVADYWWPLIPGVVMVGVDIVNKFRRKKIPFEGRLLLYVFCAGMVISQMLAYRDLKGRIVGLQGVIGSIALGNNMQTGDTDAIIEVAVTNTGLPTVALGYDLYLAVGGEKKSYFPTYLPAGGIDTKIIGDLSGRTVLHITPGDQIIEKTRRPLQTGDYQDGFVLYQLKGVRPEKIKSVTDVVWTIEFRDVYGHTFSVTRNNPGDWGPMPNYFFPGGIAPFQQNVPQSTPPKD